MNIDSAAKDVVLDMVLPDDWHLHLRDGQLLADIVLDSARQFGRAIVMPNLLPPVRTLEQASAYRARILAALAAALAAKPDAAAAGFTPLMTLYLTDETPAHEIHAAADSDVVYAVKAYPAGATTNSASGVTDLLGKCAAVLEALQRRGMPLLLHGEVTDPAVDIFDREAVFIDRVLQPLRARYPELKIVLEHLTTAEGVAYVSEAAGPIGATITAHHLLYDRNAMFQGGLRPHYYCLPVLKRARHRSALLAAATSGNPRFFLGTDSAPHLRGAKEQDCGCAGCYTARHAMALYARAFEAAGRLDRLEAFASLNGARFYGLAPNSARLRLRRSLNLTETSIGVAGGELVPPAAGEPLGWEVCRGEN